jgi:predicted exporter
MNRARSWPILVWLGGLLLCLVIIARTSFNTDLSAFLPSAPAPSEKVLVEQLHDGVISRVVLMGIEGAPPGALAALSRSFAALLRRERGFAAINNGEEVNRPQNQAFLWNNRYLLSDQVTPEHFSEANLRRALEAGLDLLNSDAAPLVKTYLPADPTGEMQHLFDAAQNVAQPRREAGVWFAPGANRALVVAQIAANTSDIDAQQKDLAIITGSFAAARQKTPGAEAARLILSGPVAFSVGIRDRIRGDAERYSLLATLLVAAILLAVYRSPRLLLFGLTPVISSVIAGIAAVSLVFGTVHGITLGFGVTLIGEAVDYPIYLFTQTAPGTPPQATLPRIWPTLRLGVLTSICGFAVMLLSSFSGLAQLGVFSIAGLLTAVCVTRWVLPPLLPENFRVLRPTGLGQRLRAIICIAPKLRWAAFILAAAALLFLGFRGNTLWDDELAGLSPLSATEKNIDQELRNQLGAPDAGYMVVVNRPTREEALAASEAVGGTLQRLVGQQVLAGFDSPSLYWPSDATQRSRQAAIPMGAELERRLHGALHDLPFKSDLFAPFLNQAATARTQRLIDPQALAGTSFAEIANTLLSRQDTGWQAILPLRGVRDANLLAREITALAAPGVLFLDIRQASDALYRDYRRQSLLLSFWGALAILTFLWLSLKRPRRVMRVVLPIFAAVVVTSALLVLAGQKLSIFHLIGLLLTVAVGSNYSLFFERQPDGGDSHTWVIVSLVLANLCTVTGFGVLSFSAIPVLHGIGMTVAIGAILSLVFSAAFSRRPNGAQGTRP